MSDKKKNFIVKQPNCLTYYICRRCGCEWISKREDNYDRFNNEHYSECPGCKINVYETYRHLLDESQLQVLDKLEKDPELFETDIFKDEYKAADIIFKNIGGDGFEEMCKSNCREPLVTCVNDLRDAINYESAKTTRDGEPVQNLTDRLKPYPTDSIRIPDPHEDLVLSELEDFKLWLRLTFNKDVCDLTEEQFKLYQETYMAILIGFKERNKDG